jgi:hypothetical protein
MLLLLRTSARWTTIHPPDARTSHLRTLSKIVGNRPQRLASVAATFPSLRAAHYAAAFSLRQHPRSRILPNPSSSSPWAFPRREPHMIARFSLPSTPREGCWRPLQHSALEGVPRKEVAHLSDVPSNCHLFFSGNLHAATWRACAAITHAANQQKSTGKQLYP